MPDWPVVAFRQPGWGFRLQSSSPNHQDIDVNSVVCLSRKRPDGRYDLDVFFPTPESIPMGELSRIASIVLDNTLGELANMTRIGEVTLGSTLIAPPGFEPICEFAAREFGVRG